MLDKEAARSIAISYAQEIINNLEIQPDSVYLFGSYINGEPTDDSDIDIAVIINNFQGNKLILSTLLWKLTIGIDDRIEPILLDSTKDESGFVEDVIKTGERIL
jgi:predicted nucleotidyltransferase